MRDRSPTRRSASIEGAGSREMPKKNSIKPWTEMTTKELAAATREFDREFIADTFRPLTQTDRRQWERVRPTRGTASRGNGEVEVSLVIKRALLAECDRLARKRNI